MPERVKEGSGATGRDRLTYAIGKETVEDAAEGDRIRNKTPLTKFESLGVLELALNHILEARGISFDAMFDAREIRETIGARFDGHTSRSVIRSKGYDHDSLAGYALELLFRFRMTRDLMAAGNVQAALLEAVQIGLALQEGQMKDLADPEWKRIWGVKNHNQPIKAQRESVWEPVVADAARLRDEGRNRSEAIAILRRNPKTQVINPKTGQPCGESIYRRRIGKLWPGKRKFAPL